MASVTPFGFNASLQHIFYVLAVGDIGDTENKLAWRSLPQIQVTVGVSPESSLVSDPLVVDDDICDVARLYQGQARSIHLLEL